MNDASKCFNNVAQPILMPLKQKLERKKQALLMFHAKKRKGKAMPNKNKS